MSNKKTLTWEWIYGRVNEITDLFPSRKFYGIPRGGQIVAGLTGTAVDKIEECDIIIDDIKDSGETQKRWKEKYNKPVIVLYEKTNEDGWIEFPWEVNDATKDLTDIVIRMIESLGEDIRRDGLHGTPERVVRSWGELFSGYYKDPKEYLRTFESGTYDQMIILKDCELYSTCEHHLLPFYGKIHIGYIPNQKVIGISKLARIAECFSRRLQIQERIGEQITTFIMNELNAKGAMCVIEARHLCMMARGVEKQNSIMVTSSVKGDFWKAEARNELLSMIR